MASFCSCYFWFPRMRYREPCSCGSSGFRRSMRRSPRGCGLTLGGLVVARDHFKLRMAKVPRLARFCRHGLRDESTRRPARGGEAASPRTDPGRPDSRLETHRCSTGLSSLMVVGCIERMRAGIVRHSGGLLFHGRNEGIRFLDGGVEILDQRVDVPLHRGQFTLERRNGLRV